MVLARTSDPPCFSVIDMPAVMPALVAGTVIGVIDAAGEPRLVDLGQTGVGRSAARRRRSSRSGRRGRARASTRYLGGAHHVRARPVVGPRSGVQAVADRHPHQLVIGGVVFDLVDPVAVAVVGVQDRLVSVGQLAPALRLRATGECAELGDLVDAPFATLADQRLGEDG